MKKIDLHIHTVATVSDRDFSFSMDTLKRYAQQSELDAIAITNHNVFDATQFRLIRDEIPIVVFPGIEINVGSGHLLLISNGDNLTDFESRCQRISQAIPQATNSVSVPELVSILATSQDICLSLIMKKDLPLAGRIL